MSERKIAIAQSTWYWLPANMPAKAQDVIAQFSEWLPDALPRRFGPGDPPASVLEGNLHPFQDAWATEATRDWGGGLNWIGRNGVFNGQLAFPDPRPRPEPGIPIGSLTLLVDAGRTETMTRLETLFEALASATGSYFACQYVLQDWAIAGGVVAMNVFTSEMSPLPGGRRWLGIPPGDPILVWLGKEYRTLLEAFLGTEARANPEGVLVYQPSSLALPDELYARSDPRFPAALPTIAASLIPTSE